MDALKTGALRGRLVKRRNVIVTTLEYVENQRRAVREHADWKDQFSYLSRENLLNYLESWYQKEIGQIDRALDRIGDNKYGVCMGCNGPIESEWLESFPETEFCRACHNLWERMNRG